MDTMPLRKRLRLRVEIQDQYVEPQRQEEEVVIEPQQQAEEEVSVEPQRQEEEQVVVELQQAAEEIAEPQQQQPEELPKKFRDKIIEMGGTEVRLIYKRLLTETDAGTHQAHLSILKSRLIHEFTSGEKKDIRSGTIGDRERGLSVRVIDPSLKEWNLKLREKNSSIYTLAYQWSHVIEANKFKAGNNVQLWSFKSDHKLCLAIVREEQ